MKKIIVGLSIATLLVTSSFSYAGISSGGMSRSTISRSVTKPSGGQLSLMMSTTLNQYRLIAV